MISFIYEIFRTGQINKGEVINSCQSLGEGEINSEENIYLIQNNAVEEKQKQNRYGTYRKQKVKWQK